MDDLKRLQKIQGSFLIARGAVEATIQTGKALLAMAEAAFLRSISVKEPDGRWFYTPFGGATWVQGEIDEEDHAAACHAAAAACWIKSSALAAKTMVKP
jgi:hypothetical protein